jgi:hypothetical protein
MTEQDDVFILSQPSKTGLNDGHRRPKLVCCVGREPPLHFHGFNQAFDPLVDRGNEGLNLTWRLINVFYALFTSTLMGLFLSLRL